MFYRCTILRHVLGVDWRMSYADMAPWYDRAEYLIYRESDRIASA